MARSYANLLDLSGDTPLFIKSSLKAGGSGGGGGGGGGGGRGGLTRSMTAGGLLSSQDGMLTKSGSSPSDDHDTSNSVTSDAPSVVQDRLILVSHMLPLKMTRIEHNQGSQGGGGFGSVGGIQQAYGGGSWNFEWNRESLPLQIGNGLKMSEGGGGGGGGGSGAFQLDMEVIYVGCLRMEVDVKEQDEVASRLFEQFKCVPVFLGEDLQDDFYNKFCKQHLWQVFHYMLPIIPDHSDRFDRKLWRAYVRANNKFADKVMEVINLDDDFVWVHDYHLMVLPTFLRKRFPKVRLGFFLHSPFPSSEIYRTLTVRDEILRALLNVDLIGFHTFDYARHFLSCCSRMLGLVFKSKRGHIGLEYYGRTVVVKIMPVGVDMPHLTGTLAHPDTIWRIGELKSEYEGKTVLLGVDDMDTFKGIGLKLLAMEDLLREHPEWQDRKAVLVQIANPARGKGNDVTAVQSEVRSLTTRINKEFGREGYEPVVLLERNVPLYERLAFYTIAQCCVVTAMRDGMNLMPYEYIVCRQGLSKDENSPEGLDEGVKRSMLVVSEFIGCSPSLSGAIRVNPWNVEAVAEAMNAAMATNENEQRSRHEKHFRFVQKHDVSFWACSFMSDLERCCREHSRLRYYNLGFGLGFRVVALDPNFRKLSQDLIAAAYRRSSRRVILLDYDGTMTSQQSNVNKPAQEVLDILNQLCSDPDNTVFIVSGREKDELGRWFAPCPRLGLAAEHGFFYKWKQADHWETFVPVIDFAWKDAALPVMEQYRECTDGSSIEAKESAVVWHHREADPDFGSWQAKELLDHLESVLVNEPVEVKSGHHIVEVKPQGVSKGAVVELVLATMASNGKTDFLLCIGDDRSDEDMFQKIENMMGSAQLTGGDGGGEAMGAVFACTVGQKPSKARYYLDDTAEVMKMLQALVCAVPMGGGGGGRGMMMRGGGGGGLAALAASLGVIESAGRGRESNGEMMMTTAMATGGGASEVTHMDTSHAPPSHAPLEDVQMLPPSPLDGTGREEDGGKESPAGIAGGSFVVNSHSRDPSSSQPLPPSSST